MPEAPEHIACIQCGTESRNGEDICDNCYGADDGALASQIGHALYQTQDLRPLQACSWRSGSETLWEAATRTPDFASWPRGSDGRRLDFDTSAGTWAIPLEVRQRAEERRRAEVLNGVDVRQLRPAILSGQTFAGLTRGCRARYTEDWFNLSGIERFRGIRVLRSQVGNEELERIDMVAQREANNPAVPGGWWERVEEISGVRIDDLLNAESQSTATMTVWMEETSR